MFGPFWVIFVYGMREGSNSILYHVAIYLFHTICLKDYCFLYWMVFSFLWKISWWKNIFLFLDCQFYLINLYAYPYVSTISCYDCLEVRFEIKKCFSHFTLFFFQACCGHTYNFHMNFRISLWGSHPLPLGKTPPAGILTGTVLNL